MSVTLKELYEQVKDKEEINLVAGQNGMDHIVRWLHMVEGIDISSFLEGDEVAFTTGIALSGQSELLELVEYNYKQKAAGMVINVGPYIEQIPEEVVAFSDAHDFPVFEVPWRVHMANIMREFAAMIHQDEQKQMEIEVAVKNAFYFPDNQEMYLPFLQRYGYKRDWSYCVAALEIMSGSYTGISSSENGRVIQFVRKFFHRWQKNVLVIEDEGEVLIFAVNVTEYQLKEKITSLWKEIETYKICSGNLYAGVGSVAENIHQIANSFSQANQVKNLQKKCHRKNQIMVYGDMGIYKLLFSLEGNPVLEEYYTEVLGELRKFDHANETDHCYFLKRYFDLECSVQDVAEVFHMHRNSVTYRIHKIEEIIGMTLNSSNNRTKIMIALMIEELVGGR